MMIEEVEKSIYRIVVPLSVPLLDSMNSYVITDPDRNLVVDTGMLRTPCQEVMEAGLKELGVDLHRTDFFMTHHHGDHFGLVSRLLTDESTIFISRIEADLVARIASETITANVAHFLEITGFPEQDVEKVIPRGAGKEYRTRQTWPFRFVEDGDLLERGGRQFRCISTPGHSAGHACLYDADARVLLSGDHLLRDITPAIQLRSDRENPLEEYLRSLHRLHGMKIGLVLPGHGPLFANCRERIEQLEGHHRERAAQVLSALSDGSKDAYQVATRIPWSIIDFEGWDTVPLLQKFFATGEAFSHLKYLENRGEIRKEMRGKTLVYSPAG